MQADQSLNQTQDDSQSQSASSWEFAATVFWMLFFLGAQLPSPLESLLKALSYPATAILVLLCWRRVLYIATRDIPILLLVGLATASIMWTIDPGLTSDGIRGLIRAYFFGAYIAARYSLREQMKLWSWILGCTAVFSVLTVLAIPSYAIGFNGWDGIFKYKNFLGFTMSIGLILFLLQAFNAHKQKMLAIAGVCLTTALIVLSRSSGALIGTLVLTAFLPMGRIVKQHYKVRTAFFILAAVVGLGLIFAVIQLSDRILSDVLQEGWSFNGRIPIWELVIAEGLKKPWLGYGFNAFWGSDSGTYIMVNTWAGFNAEGFNAHNGYLEVFLSLGLAGAGIYAVSVFTVFSRIIKLLLLTRQVEFFWLFQLMLLALLANISDSYELMLIYISICLTAAIEFDRIRRIVYVKRLLES
jgi:O-antigen ligase